MNESFRWIMFLVYTILFQGMIWIGTGIIVCKYGLSPALFILTFVTGTMQFKPESFNLETKN